MKEGRIVATEKAKEIVRQLKGEHGDLMFHISGGCCDGTAAMCLPKGELRVGDNDVLLGEVEGCPVYISRDQYEAFFKEHPQILILDVTEGRGSSFSLEIPLGVRFLVRSEVCAPSTSKEGQP